MSAVIESPRVNAAPMSVFERYLTVWVFLCIVAGIALGQLFPAAFPADENPFTIERITDALACFQRSIVSARSPYDRYHFGRDETAVPDDVKRGEILFFSGEKAGCFQCHGGVNFSGPIATAADPRAPAAFHTA